MGRDHDRLVGTNAAAVEMAFLALLSPVVWGLPTYWKYDWVFSIIAGVVGVIFLIRIMAGRAADPDIGVIRRSLRLSSMLVDLLLIGALAAITIQISATVGFPAPITVFAGLAIVVSGGFALLDQRVMGEYAETWKNIIYEETNNNTVGELLRSAADFGEHQMTILSSDESSDTSSSEWRALGLAIVLFLLLLIVISPVWLLFSILIGDWKVAVLMLLSLLFLRDVTRYVYIRYGAAAGLSELRLPLKWEFVWSGMKGIVIVWTLGYEMPAVF